MKYIEKDGNVTIENNVVINDEEELRNIVKELNEKCCRNVKVSVNVRATEDHALENFSTIGKKSVDIVKKEEDSGDKYFYECEYYRKQVSCLEYLLTTLLRNYRHNADVSGAIKQLIEYENSDEIKTYQERMAEAGITQDLYFEYENNRDFDFILLRELYRRAKCCIDLVEEEKRIRYTNGRVKKLGGK